MKDLTTVEVVTAVERFCVGDSSLNVPVDCIEDVGLRMVPRAGFAAAQDDMVNGFWCNWQLGTGN